MTDLDIELRTMLRTRALDITSVPDSIAQFSPARDDGHGTVRELDLHRPPRRRAGLLVAASVAVVLALVGLVVAIDRNGDHPKHVTPPATHQPTPRPTPSPSTHVRTSVSLSWFGMADLPGFVLHARESRPGYQWLAVRGVHDTGVPVGCNGCESASDYIYVFTANRFDEAKYGMRSGKQISVNGSPARLGTAPEYGSPTHVVPGIAWQFRPGEWVLVQGVTSMGGDPSTLQTVADAVRPTQQVPIPMPCTFGYLPDLPIVDIMDDRSEGYAFLLTMGDATGRSFAITLWNGNSLRNYDTTGKQQRSIGGLPGYYGPQDGVGVLYRGGEMTFGFGEGDGQPLPAADADATQRVIAGIRWANGDGRPPNPGLANAIP